MNRAIPGLSVLVVAGALAGCGARSGLEVDPPPDAARPDGGLDGGLDAGPGDGGVDGGPDAGCVPADDGCGMVERCGDGADDDCDGEVDEGCPCAPGAVQGCFAGPPGRRGLGACQDGQQVCEATGRWGPCEGGILPDPDACTGRDDLCTGCPDTRVCPIDCPEEGDPRVPVVTPFETVALRGRDYYAGPAVSWRWTVEGGVCDALAPNLVSFDLTGASAANAALTPRLSGDYTVRLRVRAPDGSEQTCAWIQHVEAPGLRVEMCYPESATQDLDLFVHDPRSQTRWYPASPLATAFDPTDDACGWHNCEAVLRGTTPRRADWGYGPSPLAACENGPRGEEWTDLGSCPNPRLDIDNNLSRGTGLPENVNVDQPRDGETFRVMVQNYSGLRARPVVNVYCGGRRVATFGRAPDEVPDFEGPRGDLAVGAMWRVADVTVAVDPTTGETTGCDVEGLHPPGSTSGYDVTVNDGRY